MNNKKKTILICSNCAWNIKNFRLELIKNLTSNGYHVIVVTQFDGHESTISKFVHKIFPLFISRKGINPFIDIFTILDLSRIIFKIKPDHILLFTIKPVIYGCIAAKFAKVKPIVMITGLGTAFITKNWLTNIVRLLYKFSLTSAKTVFFQNNDDKDLFIINKLVKPNLCRISPGSGVDINYFSYKEIQESSKFVFILISRMLWDKGIREYVEAAKKIKAKFPNTIFQLLGPSGVENRTSIDEKIIHCWVNENIIDYLGEKQDVRPYIENSSCVILPSYREGTSRVLLEAASIGRPTIASNVPGCKEIIDNGVTGLLCNPRDSDDLTNKIETFMNFSLQERKLMGEKARKKVIQEFNQEIVNKLFVDAINES